MRDPLITGHLLLGLTVSSVLWSDSDRKSTLFTKDDGVRQYKVLIPAFTAGPKKGFSCTAVRIIPHILLDNFFLFNVKDFRTRKNG